jgi:uncharacterized membrane protein
MAGILSKKPGRIDNTLYVTLELVKMLEVPVTAGTIKRILREHPDYPSLLSISQSLSRWNIRNRAVEVGVESLEMLPTPFIAYSASQKQLRVITALEQKDLFPASGQVVALIIENIEHAGEEDYPAKRKRELLQSGILPAAFCLFVFLLYHFFEKTYRASLLPILLLLVKSAGIAVTIGLLQQEADYSNPFWNKVCAAGIKTSCKTVLQSRGAKLGGIISWSEIGWAYFAGGWLLLVWSGPQEVPGTIQTLKWLNALALPFVAYSILYQWKIVKRWCVLCLVVQSMLLTELFSWALFSPGLSLPAHPFGNLPVTIAAFLLPYLLWLVAKPFLFKAGAFEQLKIKYNKVKANDQVFSALVNREPLLPAMPEGLGILLGDRTAGDTIIEVCDPYCSECARQHRTVRAFMEDAKDIKFQLIFVATGMDDDRRSRPVSHFLRLYQEGGAPVLMEALQDWYIHCCQEYRAFLKKYPLQGGEEEERHMEKLIAMHNWSRDARVAATPAFFLNRRRLPSVYSLEDIRFIIK